ncbi:MAG: hypothetical protein LBG47_00385 [Prevotellaceae bacterium]|jgi:hypothetical protein|nr:hypothetical protein [Prevotellaceae bacterium]
MNLNTMMKYLINAAVSLAAAAALAGCGKDGVTAGKAPAKALVAGEDANACPSLAVLLTASADGAQSYLWYRNTFAIPNATEATYSATSSGTYYAVGVNAAGQGEKSDGKEVSVNLNCPPLAPALAGFSSNQCPDLTVRLMAAAENAESYEWYRGATAIPGATAAFYDARESGAYSVAAVNAFGRSEKSNEKAVTIAPCPPAAPTISGATLNTCPETTVLLTASAGADAVSYQWYRYAEPIAGATGATHLATVTGGYYATATNAFGTSEKTANAHVVYIDLCREHYSYADLLGTYSASGTPSLFEESERGPSSWTSTILQPDNSSAGTYVITPFADFRTGDETTPLMPIYLEVGYSNDSATMALAVDTHRALGTESKLDQATGLMKTYTAYFEVCFIGVSEGKKYIYWFTDQYYQVFWDEATKTLDFSGIYTHEGVDYDLIVGVFARTDKENRKWEGGFTDGYKGCKFVQTGASGAPAAFVGERVRLPKLSDRTGGASYIKSVTLDFDPAKFSRKQ